MADDRVLSEIVTKFFLDTCQPLHQMNADSMLGLVACLKFANERVPGSNEVNLIPLITGSVAELYIQPMFTCVGDIDIMYHRSDQLAIATGTSPPTQLPAEFHSSVRVCEIIDSEFPGYVYLVSSYLLTECTDDGKYNAEQCTRKYISVYAGRIRDVLLHGPAMVDHFSPRSNYDEKVSFIFVQGSVYSRDAVPCARCLSWPSQAADWPSRHREYGWPNSATVEHIINNGCDVVNVAHRQCKQHEWMGVRQWRLSFSRAEVVLLNSWMPVQQIVYHMLRKFVKTEQLTDSADSGVKAFTNYHIKTLMLWACELKPRSWWIDDLNVVRICVELLHLSLIHI